MPVAPSKHTSGLNYPVYLGDGALNELNRYLFALPHSTRSLILTDENVYHHCLPILKEQCPALETASVKVIPIGETAKDVATVVELWKWLSAHYAGRDDLLVNLGGGVVTDLGGFVAGTYKRGIAFINIPTTLIGQADAALGGKTGINFGSVKNLAGLFNNPAAVFIYPHFLKTLPSRMLKAGYAEIIKSALITGGRFWKRCEKGISTDITGLDELIHLSIKTKLALSKKDPFDRKERMALNFGHTIGHALESHSFGNGKEPLLHGEAVAAGLYCESYLSVRLSGLDQSVLETLNGILKVHFNRVAIDPNGMDEVMHFIFQDKKNRGGSVKMTLLSAPGKVMTDQEVGENWILEAIDFYKKNFGR